MSDTLKIKVESVGSKAPFYIDVQNDDKVEVIKNKIIENMKFSNDTNLMIIYNGSILQHSQTVKESKIKNGDHVVFMVKKEKKVNSQVSPMPTSTLAPTTNTTTTTTTSTTTTNQFSSFNPFGPLSPSSTSNPLTSPLQPNSLLSTSQPSNPSQSQGQSSTPINSSSQSPLLPLSQTQTFSSMNVASLRQEIINAAISGLSNINTITDFALRYIRANPRELIKLALRNQGVQNIRAQNPTQFDSIIARDDFMPSSPNIQFSTHGGGLGGNGSNSDTVSNGSDGSDFGSYGSGDEMLQDIGFDRTDAEKDITDFISHVVSIAPGIMSPEEIIHIYLSCDRNKEQALDIIFNTSSH